MTKHIYASVIGAILITGCVAETDAPTDKTDLPALASSSGPDCLCDPGPEGPAGPQGLEGPEGPIGPQGPAGPAGQDGEDGVQGPEGPEGPEGPQGDDGERGPEGPRGAKGDDGDTGSQGPKGDKGDEGDKGDQGDPGEDGTFESLTTYPVTQSTSTVSSTTISLAAMCETGDALLHGGCVADDGEDSSTVHLVSSWPILDGPEGWGCRWYKGLTWGYGFMAYATCIDLTE